MDKSEFTIKIKSQCGMELSETTINIIYLIMVKGGEHIEEALRIAEAHVDSQCAAV